MSHTVLKMRRFAMHGRTVGRSVDVNVCWEKKKSIATIAKKLECGGTNSPGLTQDHWLSISWFEVQTLAGWMLWLYSDLAFKKKLVGWAVEFICTVRWYALHIPRVPIQYIWGLPEPCTCLAALRLFTIVLYSLRCILYRIHRVYVTESAAFCCIDFNQDKTKVFNFQSFNLKLKWMSAVTNAQKWFQFLLTVHCVAACTMGGYNYTLAIYCAYNHLFIKPVKKKLIVFELTWTPVN